MSIFDKILKMRNSNPVMWRYSVVFFLLGVNVTTSDAEQAPVRLGNDRWDGERYIERIRLRYKRDRGTGYPRRTIRDVVDVDMLFVESGIFRPSSSTRPTTAIAATKVQEVKVSAFWMSSCEITQDLLYEWLFSYHWSSADTPEPETVHAPLKDLPRPEPLFEPPDYRHFEDYDGRRPATGLTQYGVQQFCRWLTVRTGRPYRLPTEAEWEYVAQAGTDFIWPCGNAAKELREYAWFGDELKAGSHPVGEKKPNAWGFFDMSGNAAEWVLDGWSEKTVPTGSRVLSDPWVRRERTERFGVVRGGDWTDSANGVRIYTRRRQDDWAGRDWHDGWRWFNLTDSGRRVGFRVVSPAKWEEDGREKHLSPAP